MASATAVKPARAAWGIAVPVIPLRRLLASLLCPVMERASSYLVEITDTEPESTLELCRYKIEEWTSGGGSYVGTVKAVTDRACNSPIGITAGVSTILNKEAHQAWYKFIATAKNNVLPTEGTNSVWLKFDFTPPGTTIQ